MSPVSLGLGQHVGRGGRGAAAVAPLLVDEFDGSGALGAHVPDKSPDGVAWNVIAGNFAALSGGYLGYASVNYGRALQNIGVSDFECFVRTKYHQATAAQEYGGLCYRSNAAGSDYYTFTQQYDGSGLLLTGPAAGAVIFDLAKQAVAQKYKYYTAVSGTYYTWRLVCIGTQMRVYDVDGAPVYANVALAKTDQNYLGPYLANAVTQSSWDYIRVYPFTTKFATMAVCGDSISDNTTAEWPGFVTVKYKGKGYVLPKNHAVTGSSVGSHMAGQVTAAISDSPDFTLVLLGTNDGQSNFRATYRTQLNALWNGTHKPIYCLGVLNKTTDAYRDTENGHIEAAVTLAQGDGANVTYWNTDGWIDPATETSDGLHPTAAGQSKIADQVLARLP